MQLPLIDVPFASSCAILPTQYKFRCKYPLSLQILMLRLIRLQVLPSSSRRYCTSSTFTTPSVRATNVPGLCFTCSEFCSSFRSSTPNDCVARYDSKDDSRFDFRNSRSKITRRRHISIVRTHCPSRCSSTRWCGRH